MNRENHLDDSLFYCEVDRTGILQPLIEKLEEYSAECSKQVYIIRNALGSSKTYEYDIDDVVSILLPKHPIILLCYGDASDEELSNYKEDYIEDLGYLSDKYGYNKILGRARKWPDELIKILRFQGFNLEEFLTNEIAVNEHRKIDLLISLLIGSINSVESIGVDEPVSLLDKVKQKIVLFDGQQSRFIYQENDKKTVQIQGMAGTGKTELLLHKIREIYSKDKDAVLAFTCFNKVLANEMKSRITRFFNYMKVDEQIEWWKRLFAFHSWGSYSDQYSGMYRYLCSRYGLPFYTYTDNHDFDGLCKHCLQLLENDSEFEPCFDYVFIDESQDFGEGFFQLCQKVTRKKVYIAGDIFQDIFDSTIKTEINPDYLLNKCYRTDPKTLMFAHAVGMGLYERPHLNWLEDKEWQACGYTVQHLQETEEVVLSRKPLRRFEDLDTSDTIRVSSCNEDTCVPEIIRCIKEIITENPSVLPADIAIVLLGTYKTNFKIADQLEIAIAKMFSWESTKGYITKEINKGKVYISNVNNIKGLEFPFVICAVPTKISNKYADRNSFYMALTRSFLTSYFIVDETNKEFADIYEKASLQIKEEGVMQVAVPSEKEKEEMERLIRINYRNKSYRETVLELIEREYPYLSNSQRKQIVDIMVGVESGLTTEEIYDRARALITGVYKLNKHEKM